MKLWVGGKNRRSIASVFVVLPLFLPALAGCSTFHPAPDAQPVMTSSTLDQIRRWELRGRLAIKIDSKGGQATITWTRDVSRHTIRLNGPFGSGAVQIVQDEAGARLRDSEDREWEAATADQLLFQYTGWQLPVSSLEWWILGLPVPAQFAEREYGPGGHLREIRQLGWRIAYGRFSRVGGLELPDRLTLVRLPNPGAPEIEARFVIDRWSGLE